MINILKLFYRNFRKNLSTNLINLSGLTLSLTVVLMLAVYCYSELTTDQHHDKVDQTFLITKKNGPSNLGIFTPAILTDHLRSEVPEISHVVRMAGTWGQTAIKTETGRVFNIEMTFADDDFFDLFKYRVINGNLENALKEPMSMVLMKSEAIRIFGTTDIIGQTVNINNEHLVKVTAVIDVPINHSFLSFKSIIPIAARRTIQPNGEEFTNWEYGNFQTFIQTATPESDLTNIEWKIQHLFENNSSGEKSDELIVNLLPMKDIYFSNIESTAVDFMNSGDRSKVAVLLLIAFIILSIALINYVNISSFVLKERLKQTGIIKIIGATKRQILTNIISETVLIFFVSIWLAILLSEIIQPYVFKYSGIQYDSGLLLSFQFVSIAILFSVLIGIITNLIPSIQHSVSHPINNLKREIRTSTFSKRFQGYLVISQFCATIVLIAFTVLIQKQIHYSISGLGFNDKNIIAIRLTKELDKEVLKNELIRHNNIENISFTQYYPGGRISHWSLAMQLQGEDKNMAFTIFDADASFLEMTGIQLIDGRLFTDSIASDKNKALINRSFVKEYGIEKPLELKIPGFFGGNEGYEIIGVIEDFHFASKNQEIGPLVIKNSGGAFYCLAQLLTQDFSNLNSTLDFIKKKTAELSPDFPVDISFMDTAVEALYQSEIQFRRSFTFFAGCAIFISCLGILALSLFTTQQRTKEIGIRKVNGAHIEDILTLLNVDLIKWVGIAFVISLPIAWFTMNKWLENFAYKTEISWWIFAMGGLSALAIALLTVSWQSWKAARRNPVDALRYE